MPDIIIVGVAALVAICLIKIYSDKPQDSEGRTILSLQDRIVGAGVLILAVAGIIFVKSDQYGIGNPLIFLSPILIGAYVIYGRLQKNRNKR